MAARKNPGGGKGQDKVWSDAIRIAVNEAYEDGDRKKLRALAEKLVAKALDGDMAAIREIGDRLDGKPAQYSEIAGKGGAPLQLIVVTGVPLRAVEPPMVDTGPNGTAKNGASDATAGLDDD